MALQRTHRPRLRSGRSLCSLGSPLNARSLGASYPKGLSALFALTLFASSSSPPQLTGSVTDTSDVPLPGVVISLASPDGLPRRVVATDSAGKYEVAGLAPGRYRATFALEFFDSRGVDVVLDVGSHRKLDVVLALLDREPDTVCICDPLVEVKGATDIERWTRYYVKVVGPAGNPIPDVAVHFSGDRPTSVVTDLNGEACYLSTNRRYPTFKISDGDFLPMFGDFCCFQSEHASVTLQPRR